MTLFNERGESAGLLDIIEHWELTYPADIFINSPKPITIIREQLQKIKKNIKIVEFISPKCKYSIVKWKEYPAEKPNENEGDLILLLKDGTIDPNVFYTAEDSSHSHSIWKQAQAWIRFNDLKPK